LPESQGVEALPGILARIVKTKREALRELKASARALERALAAAPAPRGFAPALAVRGVVSLIAECKRRSPGAGAIRPGLDPAALAARYEAAGASAVSVLTDSVYFGGSLMDLRAARRATTIPLLRKDFTLDPLHLLEARGAGADAVLLIVRILGRGELKALHDEAVALGMDVLVEVHDAAELERALAIGARVVGINNRDLATFTTDLGNTERLLAHLPDGVLAVSESGIRGRADVERLGAVGVDAILVGEALLRADDPAVAVAGLTGVAGGDRG